MPIDFARFIKTKYTLFVPDGFHLKHKNELKRLLQMLRKANGRVHMIATGAEGQRDWPSCEELKFDYKLGYMNTLS